MVRNTANNRSRGRRECGNTMVEAALTAIIFLMVLFGIVGFGRALWAYSWTSHAAREAARWSSVRGSDGAEVATAANVTTFVREHMLGLDPNQVTVAFSAVDNDGLPNNHAGSTVVVTVTYELTQLVPWVPAMTLQSTSRMPIAQ